MRWRKSIALIENGACIAVIGLMLVAFPSSLVNAKQPPLRGCVAVSKGEYQGAKKKSLLRTRFGCENGSGMGALLLVLDDYLGADRPFMACRRRYFCYRPLDTTHVCKFRKYVNQLRHAPFGG
jgi:hypothetical protein